MGMIRLRVPDFLLRRVRELAEQDNVSINQFIIMTLSEKIAALDTVSDRAKRGSRQKFEAALTQVPDGEPDEGDRL